MKKRLICFLLSLIICLGALSFGCAALEPDRECSLRLSFTADAEPFPGLEIEIFRVAELLHNGGFKMLYPFSEWPVDIYNVISQEEWKEIAQTIRNYSAAHKIEPYAELVTDAEGYVFYEGLETGLYMVKGVDVQRGDKHYYFQDFMMYLPTPTDEGYDYHADVKPKHVEIFPPESYSVVKLWKDSLKPEGRPKSVTVDIFRDGELRESVVLSADNDWSYSWEVPAAEAGGEWSVVERDVPAGYTVTVTENKTVFTVTNSTTPSIPEIPPTGDTTPLMLYVLILCFSGLGLMLLGLWKLRDMSNEKKR